MQWHITHLELIHKQVLTAARHDGGNGGMALQQLDTQD